MRVPRGNSLGLKKNDTIEISLGGEWVAARFVRQSRATGRVSATTMLNGSETEITVGTGEFRRPPKPAHKPGCPELRARTGPAAIECIHGVDCCPTCDPCTCNLGPRSQA